MTGKREQTKREYSIDNSLGNDGVIQQSIPSFLNLFEGEVTRKLDPCVYCMKVIGLQTNIHMVSVKNAELNERSFLLLSTECFLRYLCFHVLFKSARFLYFIKPNYFRAKIFHSK